jgi:hypothetical protein
MIPPQNDINTPETPALSVRKVDANRRNALKSTGPRTPRGKGYSRMNALKHGFFAIDLFQNFLVSREQPQDFKDLVDQLRTDYEPVGTAEQLEVQWIAVCWWRRKRAWRYENAELFIPSLEVAEIQNGLKARKHFYSGCVGLGDLLKKVKEEIKITGGISQDLKDKMFATYPSFQQVWERLEDIVTHNEAFARQEAIHILKECNKDLQSESVDTISLAAVTSLSMYFLEHLGEENIDFMGSVAHDHHAIPDGDALEKIIRYTTSIDRELGRAQDRLDRLQRRRRDRRLFVSECATNALKGTID